MRGLNRRVDALEQSDPPERSLAIKAWLGWSLTDEERAQLAKEEAQREPIDWNNVDTTGWSKEAIKWWHERC
jgi:hypothetical protein